MPILIRLIKNLSEAQAVWRALSPGLTIYDDWDFRKTFYDRDPQEIFFYAAYDDTEPVGLLPLEYYPALDYLDFFGGEFMDSNRCFTKTGREDIIPEIYKSISRKAALFDIIGDDIFTRSMDVEDYNYILRLEGLADFDAHLERSFDAHRRKNFRRDKRIFGERYPGLSLHYGRAADLDPLFELNIKRHGDESYISLGAIREGVRALAAGDQRVKIMSLEIDGQVEGVYFGMLQGGVFHSLIVGSNSEKYPGIGNYMQIEFINWAIRIGAKVFDAGLGDCGWKERWHFEKEPQYEWSNF